MLYLEVGAWKAPWPGHAHRLVPKRCRMLARSRRLPSLPQGGGEGRGAPCRHTFFPRLTLGTYHANTPHSSSTRAWRTGISSDRVPTAHSRSCPRVSPGRSWSAVKLPVFCFPLCDTPCSGKLLARLERKQKRGDSMDLGNGISWCRQGLGSWRMGTTLLLLVASLFVSKASDTTLRPAGERLLTLLVSLISADLLVHVARSDAVEWMEGARF